MYKLRYLTLIFLLPFIFSACKKGATVKPAKNSDTTIVPYSTAHVYVAGGGQSPNGIGAICWKDGVSQFLSDNTPQSVANAIMVSGNDIYAAGFTNALYGADIAVYWKNGTETPLTSGSVVSQANGIFVSGADVYVAGVVYATNGLPQAVYWKNGVLTVLSDPGYVGRAFAIAVNGQDVYVAGYVDNSAVYWKNGVPTTLDPDPSMDPSLYSAKVSSIVISGNDLYFAGNVATYSSISGVYWKNGVATQIRDGIICSLSQTAGALAVNGQDVYVAGFTKNVDNKAVATYWKNGTEIKITDGKTNAEADAITVSGNDVYISGLLDGNATFWKNGSAVQLTNSANISAANGIAVVPK